MRSMQLIQVPAQHIDFAWRDGASCLVEACESECTGDQLKMLLGRGERQLVRMDSEDRTVGWGVFRVDLLPNMRVLHITNLVAHNAHFEMFFTELKKMAELLGCSVIRCAAKPAQEKLYTRLCGFKPVYRILEVEI